MAAAQNGHLDVVKYLVDEQGAARTIEEYHKLANIIIKQMTLVGFNLPPKLPQAGEHHHQTGRRNGLVRIVCMSGCAQLYSILV